MVSGIDMVLTQSPANLRIILAGVRTTRFFAGGCGCDGLDGTLQDVAEFQCLDEVTARRAEA
jgi:hypothetical protein